MVRGSGDPRNMGHEKALDVRSILLVDGIIDRTVAQLNARGAISGRRSSINSKLTISTILTLFCCSERSRTTDKIEPLTKDRID